MNNVMSMPDSNNEEATMTSIELRDLVNQARLTHNGKAVRNDHFIARIEDELEGELGSVKVFHTPRAASLCAFTTLLTTSVYRWGCANRKPFARV